MAGQIISCPFCAQQYTVPPEQVETYVDREVPCSNCHAVFLVQKQGEFLKGVTPPAAAAPPSPPSQQPTWPQSPSQSSQSPQSPQSQPPTAYLAYSPPPPSTTNAMAIAGLVCGIAGFVTCGVGGIVGLICSIIGLRRSKETGTGRGLATAGIIVSVLSTLLLAVLPASVLIPALSRARQKANEVKCSANLRQIGQAAMLYAQDYSSQGGPFAPNFQALVSTLPLSPKVLECPSDASPGTGQFGSTKCSYIWLGANLSYSSRPDCVLAYEPLSNHKEGCNVLYADGHVEFVDHRTATQMINQLKAGQNPPPATSGLTDPVNKVEW